MLIFKRSNEDEGSRAATEESGSSRQNCRAAKIVAMESLIPNDIGFLAGIDSERCKNLNKMHIILIVKRTDNILPQREFTCFTKTNNSSSKRIHS